MTNTVSLSTILLEESQRLTKQRQISKELAEALEQAVTSMMDSGYRADSAVIRCAQHALAQHREAQS